MLSLLRHVAWNAVSQLLLAAFAFFLMGKASRVYLEIVSACKPTDRICAFYHPYCDGGGGGERVLWMTVDAILQDGTISKNLHIVIYSGSSKSKKEILKHVRERFSIDLRNPFHANKITFMNISSHVLTEAKWYPVATMICQCLASIIVGFECVLKASPHFYVDTTGAAFTYPIFRVISRPCRIIAYVHYPIISSDMLAKVREQRPDYNNSESITKSTTISTAKLAYYSVIARIYGYVGRYATTILVNSSWTKDHISGLWREDCKLVYPPCNTAMMQAIPLEGREKAAKEKEKEKNKVGVDGAKYFIVSVGQFRKEKDHLLQLRSMRLWVDRHGVRYPGAELVIIGSTRNEEDEQLQSSLAASARELGLEKEGRVRFVINAPFQTLTEWMARGHIGLHTMWCEHFGISVVEMMAAGLVMIAHDSGGPRMDIVNPALRAGDIIPPPSPDAGLQVEDTTKYRGTEDEGVVGYVAGTPDEFATCIQNALDLINSSEQGTTATSDDGETCNSSSLLALQQRARRHVGGHFSDGAFTHYMQNLFRSLVRASQEEDTRSVYARSKAWLLRHVLVWTEQQRKKYD